MIIYTNQRQRILISKLDKDLVIGAFTLVSGYATFHQWGKRKTLHRVIVERKYGRPIAKDEVTDHINRNKLDNRRENLRLVTKQQNAWNARHRTRKSNPYRGVYRSRDSWKALITHDKCQINIGTFSDPLYAAYMYDQYALALRGEYAYLNVL